MIKKPLIVVELLAETNIPPEDLISYCAKICYQDTRPQMGEHLDIEKKLFKTGHHTTLEHNYFTFYLSGLPISEVTLGFHLTHPFYNSSQQSGRFCSAMFDNPDIEALEDYIKLFYPKITPFVFDEIIDYITDGLSLFKNNIDQATKVVSELLKKERPLVSNEYLSDNSRKIAQEQLRMILSTIFPTSFAMTVDLITITSLYYSAWSPTMRYVVNEMAAQITNRYPELNFLFRVNEESDINWSPILESGDNLINSPQLKIISANISHDIDLYIPKEKSIPIDLLNFLPPAMNNSLYRINYLIEISMATMGQKQRHRMNQNGLPKFTGNFYAPKIIKECLLEKDIQRQFKQWKSFYQRIPGNLFANLAPYGAMVEYTVSSDINTLIHEFKQRLCFSAQEEFYNLALKLRNELNQQNVIKLLQPPCLITGKCQEAKRYCGRDIQLRKTGNYFPLRMV